jgi:hypothetical protein
MRAGPFDIEHRQSDRRQNDRMRHRPPSLLRWLQEQYALEAPARLHAHALEADGDPVMNGEARAYIGFSQGVIGGAWFAADAQANDWVRVASRCDPDGRYVTPMRAAIARVGDPAERSLLGELACNVLFPLDVTRAHRIPDWCRNDVVNAVLERLWRNWRDAPLPRPTGQRGISDAQAEAEAEPVECDHDWEQRPASRLYIDAGYPVWRCRRCARWAQEVRAAA